MKWLFAIALVFLGNSASIFADTTQPSWPTWRGPDKNGLATGNPPIEWSETKNVKWKLRIPGLGHATPIT